MSSALRPGQPDLASLRIAEDRIEWGVKLPNYVSERPNRDEAEYSVRYFDHIWPGTAPHRVVSRRVITTEWADADETVTLTRRGMAHAGRGFFAVGIYGNKTPANLGTLWRTASLYEAAFVFTVRKRYIRQASDTPNTPRHKPLFHFTDIDDLVAHLPHGCPLVGVELDPRAIPLPAFGHPLTAAYLLGAEDNGLPAEVVDRCHYLVQIPTPAPWSMNVAVAGSIIVNDRHVKAQRRVEASA